jgi:GAF domain-containing protein
MSTEELNQEQLHRDIADMRHTITALQTLVDTPRNAEAMLAERTHMLALSVTVGTILAGSDSLRTILQRCAEALVQHLGLAAACIWTLDAKTTVLDMQASAGIYTPLDSLDGPVPIDQSAVGFLVWERQPYVTNTVIDDVRLLDQAWAHRAGVTAFAGYPLVVENRLVGVMVGLANEPFPDATLQALAWVAGVIALGIDRIGLSDALARSIAKVIRANKCLRRKNAELDEFTYVASHDLQEPLRQLVTFSHMLRGDLGENLPEPAKRDLEFIVDTATHVQTLIQHFLNLVRAEPLMRYHGGGIPESASDQPLETPNPHLKAADTVDHL